MVQIENERGLPDIDDILPGDTNASQGTGSTAILPISSPGISTKEMAIAGGALLLLAIVFWIIKSYLSRMLVANFKKSPRAAEMAGWSFFGVLFFAAIAAAMGILDSTKLFSLPYLIPIGLAMTVSLLVFLISLVSKR